LTALREFVRIVVYANLCQAAYQLVDPAMDESPQEAYAREVLEARGFCVERLPTSNQGKTADYRAQKGDQAFFVEVTNKSETDFLLDLYKRVRLCGMATDDRELRVNNTIDGIVREKATQLAATPGRAEQTFLVLWFSALNRDSEFLLRTVKQTIYGLQMLSVLSVDGSLCTRPCFFYHNYSFYRAPGLDGVVLVGRSAGMLCLNSRSPRYGRFRESEMAAMFRGSVCDPKELEVAGKAFTIDEDIDRQDQCATFTYLRRKYGVRTAPMLTSQFLGFAAAPNESEETTQGHSSGNQSESGAGP
jgi:hypothetical protein